MERTGGTDRNLEWFRKDISSDDDYSPELDLVAIWERPGGRKDIWAWFLKRPTLSMPSGTTWLVPRDSGLDARWLGFDCLYIPLFDNNQIPSLAYIGQILLAERIGATEVYYFLIKFDISIIKSDESELINVSLFPNHCMKSFYS